MGKAQDRGPHLKAALAAVVDRAGAELPRFGEDVFDHAELGFREERTARWWRTGCVAWASPPQAGLAVTGVKARLKGARPGPTVCVLGELDGLPIPEHHRADPSTGVVHACAHNAQLTHLLPVLHPSHGGCVGTNHAADFQIQDADVAYITPAKAMAWTIVDLLSNDATQARRVLRDFQPRLTGEAYLAHMRGLARTERYP